MSVLRTGLLTTTSIVRHEPTGKLAVQKELSSRLANDPAACQAFASEAAALLGLAGRGAPRLLAHGDDAGRRWLVLEHVAWPSLAQHMDRWGQEPESAGPAPRSGEARADFVERLVRMAFQTLGAVHDASDHAGPLQVVHGDISPDNLLVADGASDCAFIDFALSHSRNVRPGAAGAFRGTALYAAPEVARGELATPASDVFALALSLLHARSSRCPRRGSTLSSVIAEAGTESVIPYAEQSAENLPLHTRAVLLRCVAFEPEDRPRSTDAAADAQP